MPASGGRTKGRFKHCFTRLDSGDLRNLCPLYHWTWKGPVCPPVPKAGMGKKDASLAIRGFVPFEILRQERRHSRETATLPKRGPKSCLNGSMPPCAKSSQQKALPRQQLEKNTP